MGTRRGAAAVLAATIGLATVLATGAPAGGQTEVQDGPPICGTADGTGPAAPDDGRLRVASYNILHSQPRYADETMDRRIELVGEALAEADVDVVGLQEVVRSANHGMVAERIAADLATRTGDDWAWCFFQSNPHLPLEPDTGPGGIGGPISQAIANVARAGDSPWAEGVAIVSRYPISASSTHRLVNRAAEAPVCQVDNPDNLVAIPTCVVDTRQVLWARTVTPCGDLDLFSTHLANNESSQSEVIRQAQIVDALLSIDQRAAEDAAPDVFVGDFNTLEDGPVWQAVIDAGFVDGFRVSEPDAPGLTSGQDIADPESTASRRIDFVFARPGTTPIDPTDGAVIGDSPAPFAGSEGETVVWPSDHYGVAVTLLSGSACDASPEPDDEPPATTDDTPKEAAAAGEPSSVALPATGRTNPSPAVLLLLTGALAATALRRRVAGSD